MFSLYKNVIISSLILLVGLEIESILFPIIGKAGTVIWILTFLLLIFETVRSLYKIILNSVSNKSPLTLIVLVFFIIIIFAEVFNILNSNFEATQEIGCTLKNFESIDFGFRGTCLFGYPDRQFFIPALPSLVFGRGLFSLNIGGALFFTCGIIMYAYGLLKFFKKSRYSDVVSAITISSVFHFYFINLFLFNYEEGIFPFSFALMITGLLLSLTHENFYKNLGLVGILIGYLIFAYTTGLFFLFFVIAVIFYLFFSFTKTLEQKKFIGFIIITGLIFLISSLLFRYDIRLHDGVKSSASIISDIINGFQHLLIRGSATDYVSFVFQPFFIAALLAPFLSKQRKYYLFIFVWIVGVFALSIASKGYSYYSVDVRIHRAIVVVPIVLVYLGVVIESIKIPFIKKSLLYYIILMVLFVSAVIYQNGIIKSKLNGERHRHVSFLLWLKDKLSSSGLSAEGKLIFENQLMDINHYSSNYTSVQDNMQYYFPKLKACSVSICPPQNNTNNYYVKAYDGVYDVVDKELLGIFDFNGDKVEVYKEKL